MPEDGVVAMWWRIFVPTWRFFDAVGSHSELLVKVNDQWRPAVKRPRIHWYSLLFNPDAGFYHACHNLLDRLVSELGEGNPPAQLVSFALVQDLAGGREFKVMVDGEEVLHSPGAAS